MPQQTDGDSRFRKKTPTNHTRFELMSSACDGEALSRNTSDVGVLGYGCVGAMAMFVW